MAWKKLLLEGDLATDLTGTAYRLLLIDSGGAVIELIHGAASKVLTSQGPGADPTWEDPGSGPHALDAGQTDVVITTPADNEVLAYDGIGDWINQTPSEAGLAPDPHDLGGSEHGADTLVNLNLKVSDATLDDSSDPRTPSAHKASHESGGGDALDATLDLVNITLSGDAVDGAIIATPQAEPSGTTEGTIYYDSTSKHLYCYVV